jgi:5'-nucleotidase
MPSDDRLSRILLKELRLTISSLWKTTNLMSSHEPTLLILTNDDGVEAPGILALEQAAATLGTCRVIAPLLPHSGCGHQVTTHAPIGVETLGENRMAVSGTPVDCVRLAIHSLGTNAGWFLSGVNAGGNLGTDVYHSGTVAAVREAALRGYPGIAVSHYIARGRTIDWVRAAEWTHRVLRTLMRLPREPFTFWNVNLPHPPPGNPEPEMVFCALDTSPLPLDYRYEPGRATYAGDYQKRLRQPRADIDVCFGGQIAISLIRLAPSERQRTRNAEGDEQPRTRAIGDLVDSTDWMT